MVKDFIRGGMVFSLMGGEWQGDKLVQVRYGIDWALGVEHMSWMLGGTGGCWYLFGMKGVIFWELTLGSGFGLVVWDRDNKLEDKDEEDKGSWVGFLTGLLSMLLGLFSKMYWLEICETFGFGMEEEPYIT